MATRRPAAGTKRKQALVEPMVDEVPAPVPAASQPDANPRELVIVTGMSGSGKASALKTFEDLGYYSVDNLPLELIPRFADLVAKSAEIERAALVVDVREGIRLERFPVILKQVRKVLPTRVVFLEASEEVIVRRFSETRRPHPLGRGETVVASIRAERKRLDPIRNVADILLDTSKFNVHELRAHLQAQFGRAEGDSDQNLTIAVNSFGFKNGVPAEPISSSTCASCPIRTSSRSSASSQASTRAWPSMCGRSRRRGSFSTRRRTCSPFCCRTT